MLIEKLTLPEKVISLLKESGIEKLNPPQIDAIKNGLFEKKNMVVAAPTASGKTLIAELAIIKNFLEGGKSVYLLPLKALASEKYEDFAKYKKIGMRVAVSTGDYDSGDDWLGNYDLIIASNEKMDSILRHSPNWIKNISLIIADEIHLLDDASRGPVLEIVLTRLMHTTNSQLIALSATIKNSEEIADWLGAELIKSDYRPIRLDKGVFYPDENSCIIDFSEKEPVIFSGLEEGHLIRDTLKRKKQALVFVSTRRGAEAHAEKLAKHTVNVLNAEEKVELAKLSKSVEKALDIPTKQCTRLAGTIKSGVAFHHAGLIAKQRKLVEDAFRAGTIKFITATPTLAFGMNLPAWRVLIRDAKRYGSYGYEYIPVFEVHQMMGRAGRPKYDKEGEAILIAKSLNEAGELKSRYIDGEPEKIYSKLSAEPILRTQTLALISSGISKKSDLMNFFDKTFFAYQYEDIKEIKKKIEKILGELESFNFIEISKKGKFISEDFIPAFNIDGDIIMSATKLGRRVSELYIDPLSANIIIKNMARRGIESIMAINECREMNPLISIRKKDMDFIEEELMNSGIKDIPDVWDIDYDSFLERFKTSLFFNEWMNEASENALLEKFGVAPGELYAKIKNAEWMLYAAKEFAIILGSKEAANSFNKLMLRIKYGVKEGLLSLINIKGIGRVRARALYKNGIKSLADLRNAKEELLAKLVGAKLAKSIKSEAVSMKGMKK